MIQNKAKSLIDSGKADMRSLREEIHVLNVLSRNLRLKTFWTVFVGGDPMYRQAYQAELDVHDRKLRELWQAWTLLYWKEQANAT